MMMRALGLEMIVVFLLILAVMVYVYYTNARNANGLRRKKRPVEINWEVANDDALRTLLPEQTIEAIKLYREMTGADLKTAKTVIDYLNKHPDDYGEDDKEKIVPRDAGIRDLVQDGRINEAIAIYRDFTGLSIEESAQDIAQIEQELALGNDWENIDDAPTSAQNRL